MARQHCGENFPLDNDGEILAIDSPGANVGGPYVVVTKSIAERWAIVAMRWDNASCLGIRWFWANNGYPHSFNWGTWLVIPTSLSNIVRPGLPLENQYHLMLEGFLTGAQYQLQPYLLQHDPEAANITLCWQCI